MELARYVEPNSRMGRVVDSGMLQPANRLWLKAGFVCWSGGGRVAIQPSVEILDDFILLWRKDDSAVLEFSKRYGPPRRPFWVLRNQGSRLGIEGRKSIESCKSLSRRAFSVITVAAKLRAQAYIDTNLSFQQWNDLYFQQWNDLSNGRLDELRIMDRYLRVSSLIPEDRNEVDMLRLYLTKELDIWNTTLGPVSFSIERDYNTDDAVGAGLKTVLDFGGSVLCYIGLQLMLVIAGGDIFLCSACGAPYIRPRGRTAPRGMRKSPKPGERNYCQSKDCIRERNRIAADTYRQRHKTQSKERKARQRVAKTETRTI